MYLLDFVVMCLTYIHIFNNFSYWFTSRPFLLSYTIFPLLLEHSTSPPFNPIQIQSLQTIIRTYKHCHRPLMPDTGNADQKLLEKLQQTETQLTRRSRVTRVKQCLTLRPRLLQTRRAIKSGTSGSNTANTSTSRTPKLSSNLAPKLGADGRLNQRERQCHIDQKLCLFCSKPGHMASIAKARTALVTKDKPSSAATESKKWAATLRLWQWTRVALTSSVPQ